MSGSDGLRWTGWTAAYAAAGLAGIAVAVWLDRPVLLAAAAGLLCWIAIDAALVSTRKGRVRLEASPARIPEGARLSVQVEAHGLRGAQLRVDLPASFELAEGSNQLEPGSRHAELGFQAAAHQRGPQPVGPVRVRRTSPAGLWVADRTAAAASTVEVVPQRIGIDEVLLTSRVLQPMAGRFQVNRPGHGFDFFTLRQYQPSDTLRSINWKASARTEDLVVNQRIRETLSSITILLDARLPSGIGRVGATPLDGGCRLALSLFEDAVKQRDVVHFLAYGDGLLEVPTTGAERVVLLEALLGRLAAAGEMPLAAAWTHVRSSSPRSGPVILVSSLEADDTAVPTVRDLLAAGHPVSVISPRPGGPGWERVAARQAAREKRLDALRGSGAVVVDWDVARPVAAAAPAVMA